MLSKMILVGGYWFAERGVGKWGVLPVAAMAVEIYNLCDFYRKEREGRKVKATTSLRTLRPSR